MSTEGQPKRKRIKQLEVMVADVVRETADTSTLVLFTGNDKLDYKPGHFLTIDPHQFPALARWTQYLEDVKGSKEKPRAYSMESAPHERYLAVTIKEEEYFSGSTEYPPLLSPVLVRRTAPGTRMTITGFTGPYVLPEDIETRTDHIVHICAGSGVVPNWAIIKHAIHHNMKLKHTLIYGNKTFDDIIYRHQLEDLAQEHPNQLRVIHALSREKDATVHGANYRNGRVTEELLRDIIEDPSAVEVFACGPAISKFDKRRAKKTGEELRPRFMESVLDGLHKIGFTKKQIHEESYG
jgi:ferredoxin-NADP reductase